jgi:hypothetical protein
MCFDHDYDRIDFDSGQTEGCQMKPTRTARFLFFIAALIIAGLACSSGSKADPTAENLGQIFALTVTAEASKTEDTNNPLKTAQVEATEQYQALEATQEANNALNSESQRATQAAEAPIKGELALYDVDPEKGHVAWIHPPVTLEIDSYMAIDYANEYAGTIAADFVISSDITWNTEYGSSGCGYMLRSDGNQNTPNTYLALITRGGSGHLVFGILENGEPDGGYDIFPRDHDRSFDWHNDVTNRFTVIGRGSVFTFYTNGIWVGEIDLNDPPPEPVMPAKPAKPADQNDKNLMDQYAQQLTEYEDQVSQIQDNYAALLGRHESNAPVFEKGFISLVTVAESGHTVCQFDNAWLWLIDE